MAKVIMQPIGAELAPGGDVPEAMLALEAKLSERRAEVRAGWGEKYHARTKAKGKMTPKPKE